MSSVLSKAINTMDNWKRIETKQSIIYRAEIQFKPFIRANRDTIILSFLKNTVCLILDIPLKKPDLKT